MLPDLPLMLIPAGVRFQDCHFKKLGNGWLNAVHDDDKAAIINGWQNATTNKKVSEYRFMRPDGKIAWVMGQSIPEKFRKSDCGLWVPLQILQSVSRLRIEFLKKDYSQKR
jgi:hypothetical protein